MRTSLMIALAALLASCSGMKMSKRKLTGITPSMDATYFNASTEKSATTLLAIFDISAEQTDVRVKFDAENDLRIEYKNVLGGIEFKTFKGKFRNGFFETFLIKDRVNIPLVYSKVNVLRVRVCIDKEGSLVADRYLNRSGNLFIFSGGGRSRQQFFFRRPD